MKVGTDGVLLGCYVDEAIKPTTVMDIGAGTGLLALMMAQKFPSAQIDAVEIDAAAAGQAQENFFNSIWSSRLNMHHSSFQTFVQTSGRQYQLIVCNPPFFKQADLAKGNNLQHPNEQRARARFSDHLPFSDLIKGVTQLLQSNGSFYVILPIAEASELKQYCFNEGLYLQKELFVTGREGAKPNRSIMCWNKVFCENTEVSTLLMYRMDTSPTDEYVHFTKDFYLWKQFDVHPGLKL
jgi:tRNA1Val (adenine37-N6)-methyltransferase